MENLVAFLLSAGSGLVVGYLLGYWNYGLTVKREAANRRREFRDAIRSIGLRYDGIRQIAFLKTYDDSVHDVKQECLKVVEDVSWLRRRSFIEYRDKYCGFAHSDLEVPRPKTPAHFEEYLKANREKREKMTVILKETLEGLIRCAK